MTNRQEELIWKDSSSQEIPGIPDYDSLLLEGGKTEPVIWKPEADLPASPSRAEWVLRYVPSGILIGLEQSATIGSSADNSLIIDDSTISKHHAKLTLTDKGWLLEDTGSLNGTFIENILVTEPVILAENSEFVLARNRKFRLEKVETNEHF